MRNYLAVWTWVSYNDRRLEITMSFWATCESDARRVAHRWWDSAWSAPVAADFTLTDLSAERTP